MLLLSAKPAAEEIKKNLSGRVSKFSNQYGRAPSLAVVLIGSDPASEIYTSSKGKAATKIGMEHVSVKIPGTATFNEVQEKVAQLNEDDSIDGILIQRPLPFKEGTENPNDPVYWVSPEKDVDAFHPANIGKLYIGMTGLVPCTPFGIMKLFEHYKIELAGKRAVVVGRSNLVGKPIASMLLAANATVTQCHSKTKDMRSLTKQAEILVVAAGRKEFISADDISEGVVLVDVGIHRNENGKLSGDVDFDSVSKIAAACTPVPGGVGPMTITMLLANTVNAAERRASG